MHISHVFVFTHELEIIWCRLLVQSPWSSCKYFEERFLQRKYTNMLESEFSSKKHTIDAWSWAGDSSIVESGVKHFVLQPREWRKTQNVRTTIKSRGNLLPTLAHYLMFWSPPDPNKSPEPDARYFDTGDLQSYSGARRIHIKEILEP